MRMSIGSENFATLHKLKPPNLYKKEQQIFSAALFHIRFIQYLNFPYSRQKGFE